MRELTTEELSKISGGRSTRIRGFGGVDCPPIPTTGGGPPPLECDDFSFDPSDFEHCV